MEEPLISKSVDPQPSSAICVSRENHRSLGTLNYSETAKLKGLLHVRETAEEFFLQRNSDGNNAEKQRRILVDPQPSSAICVKTDRWGH